MLKAKDSGMHISRTTYERVEPALTSFATARDEAVDPVALATSRFEPVWIGDGDGDFAVGNSVSNSSSINSRLAPPRNAVAYRTLDWLSAIALLMASVAIALALNRDLF